MYDGLKGFRDFYPGEQSARREVTDAIEGAASRYGFREVATPALERTEMYVDKSGEEIVEELYAFEDKGGRGVAMTPELGDLQSELERRMQRIGLEPERRKFAPHVTLARFKSNPGARLQDYLADHSLVRAGPIAMESFELYSSFTSANGAIYQVEASYPLEPVGLAPEV